ncbi:MAG: hypothetical protein U0Q18_18270 [Bryobacteraceae bacterium]
MSTSRRQFVSLGPALWALPYMGCSVPAEAASVPVPETHFPGRLYLFVWRNWELANADRMANVLGTTADRILELGRSMGLPRKPVLTADQIERIYVTVIRQNWHVLPEDQITQLLGWDSNKLAFTLKEDDFLEVKLGPKPECPRLTYTPPSATERDGAARIARIVREVLGATANEPGEPPFHFISKLNDRTQLVLRDRSVLPGAGEIDLTSGWRIATREESAVARAAAGFGEYLGKAMGASLNAGGANIIQVESLPRGPGGGAFRIEVSPTDVQVQGYGQEGVFDALNLLRDRMEERGGPFLSIGTIGRKAVWEPRYLYSFFALYGDPLMQPEIDPFPDGYLEKLARDGISGVWMQAVLNTLAPSARFPEFGAGSDVRLANLDKLVERVRQFGMKVYLYLNEPRAMPAAFFANRSGMRGVAEGSTYAMCTSVPAVREWIADSLAHITQRVPGLGGFFTITMSENLTHCFSHGASWGRGAPEAKGCERCSKRRSWEVIGELIQTFRDGIRRSGSSAELINWDWGWGDELARNLIPRLPADSRFLSVSEWEQPVHRGGRDTEVGEYSISVVGPGPRAQRNWAMARQHGIPVMAKVQFNSTWEISAVPYIPVTHLILRHCENLSRAGIAGLMASWTCGGYPSPNLDAAKAYYLEPRASRQQILESIAVRRYGRRAAPEMIEAWRCFSDAFEQFPYGVGIYTIPTQHGPANLLRFHPTAHSAAMILFPHDDLKAWCGPYTPEEVLGQFRKLADGWLQGLTVFRAGLAKVASAKRIFAETDLAVSETCYNHFRSVANQVEFYTLREKSARTDVKKPLFTRMRALAKDEIELARSQYRLARNHSVIAYEASNHYYYRPLDLLEKILNCRHLVEREIPS